MSMRYKPLYWVGSSHCHQGQAKFRYALESGTQMSFDFGVNLFAFRPSADLNALDSV